jgi:MFS family permease
MAVYPVAFLFTAPFVGGHMQNLGRKNSVFIGVILMTFATFLFGMGSFCHHELQFFAVSFLGRML